MNPKTPVIVDTEVVLPCPAKINLMLHITGQLENGYHSLQTVFQILDYGDQLTLSATNDGTINLLTPFENVASKDNLIVRAACLLQKISNCSQGANISVLKKLPMGGGLGGGSSDAATTLVGLNHLWATGISLTELAKLGLQLGADVPVFVEGYSAWAEGIGEILTPVELPNLWYLVIFPNIHVNTAKIFSHPELTRNTPIMTIHTALESGGQNDCEKTVRKLYPEVDSAMQWLDQYAPAKLTGTGSCLFAVFDNEQQAQEIYNKLPGKFSGFIAQALNRSPLHSSLNI